jgi:hypothetical protein
MKFGTKTKNDSLSEKKTQDWESDDIFFQDSCLRLVEKVLRAVSRLFSIQYCWTSIHRLIMTYWVHKTQRWASDAIFQNGRHRHVKNFLKAVSRPFVIWICNCLFSQYKNSKYQQIKTAKPFTRTCYRHHRSKTANMTEWRGFNVMISFFWCEGRPWLELLITRSFHKVSEE